MIIVMKANSYLKIFFKITIFLFRKMLICEYIKHEYSNLTSKQLIFFKIEEASLFDYTTAKKDFKKKISRKPK